MIVKEFMKEGTREKGFWEELAMLNYMRLQSKFLKGDLHEDVAGMIERVKDFKVGLSRRKELEDG